MREPHSLSAFWQFRGGGETQMQSAEYGVRNMECGVRSAKRNRRLSFLAGGRMLVARAFRPVLYA
jgi:hypothetical protein